MRLHYQSREFIDWEPLIQVTYECTLACQTFEVPYGVTVYETFKLHFRKLPFSRDQSRVRSNPSTYSLIYEST